MNSEQYSIIALPLCKFWQGFFLFHIIQNVDTICNSSNDLIKKCLCLLIASALNNNFYFEEISQSSKRI